MGVHRLARLIFALVVAMIVVASPSTTTATAAKFTYDVPSYARVDVRNVEGAEAGPERPGLALEDSASPPSSARGTSAPRSVAFVATEAVSTPEVTLDGARYPESAAHAQDAIGGNSAEYTIDRAGAAARRAAAMEGQPRIPGMDRDEWPPAMFQEGGEGSSVRGVTPGDNRGAGASIGNQCRGLPDGTLVRIVIC